jgi:hypothetical protein
MIYILALLPATMLTIAGYVVMFLAARSEGGLKAFGKYLAFWAFTLAALVILGAIFAAAAGRHGHRGWMHGDHGRMHGPWPGGPPPPWAGLEPEQQPPPRAPEQAEPQPAPAPPANAPAPDKATPPAR